MVSASTKNIPNSSFNLRNSFKQVSSINHAKEIVSVENVSAEKTEVEFNEEFDVAKFQRAIAHYLSYVNLETSVATALKTHLPIVKDANVKIFVDNTIQLGKLEELKMHIQKSMSQILKNKNVRIDFELFKIEESNEEKKLFTGSEKMEHFIKLNPVVAELKSVFGLELK